MQIPDKPCDEDSRVDTLHALNILDTLPEERFDRLTRLAKRMFSVPIALVSLVDEDRQWFKSRQGLNVSQTPRDISFCGHAILADDIFLIADTKADARFRDNPLVVDEPNIRFYAGCPLKAANGSRLGTLCLIDRVPRNLCEEDLGALRDLAHMAEQELAAVQLATMDELTMLSNRRGFEALSRQVLNMSRRSGDPVTLLYFDLDHFKGINDQFGHSEGDRVLQLFGQFLKETFRDTDVLGRLGGDEFAVMMSGVSEMDLIKILQRLRHTIDGCNNLEKLAYEINFSVGQIEFDTVHHLDVADLLQEADVRMYENKNQRRAA